MSVKKTRWHVEAQALGFLDEKEMLDHLYTIQQFSLQQISLVLGFTAPSIRERLIEYGIHLRGRGGPQNRQGRRLLKDLTVEELLRTPAALLAERRGVHISTIYSEIRLRQKEIQTNAVLPNNASESVRTFRQRQQDSHGPSPVSSSPSVQEILRREIEEGGDGDPGQRSV